MSLSSLLTKLINARGAIVDAISSKGVSISSSATLLSCASAVLNIPQGSGGTDVSDTTAEAADVLSGKVFYDSAGSITSGSIPTVSASIDSGAVVVPSGYIAEPQSFPVSAGIDVSDTTAEAENVQSGYYFYNSAGVKTEGTLTVSAGIDVSDTTADAGDVLEGKVFHDSAGVLTSGTIPVVSGGSVIVPGTAEQLIVSSGGAFVNGSLAVAGDTALVASNIMSGITIFGVTGTAESGSGGVDVSDTTAEAENVQSGYYFYDSAGVKTEGTLTVSAGIDVSDTTATASMVLAGAVFHDSQGAVTTGTIPTVSAAITSGAVVVPSGYIAEPQSFPVSGGSEEDATLGYVSGGVFYELSFSGTSSIEASSSAGLSAYSWNLPASSSGTVISSGGTIITPVYISSGQIFDSMTVSGSNGTLHVLSGGIAYNTTLEKGSLLIHGGTAVNVSGAGYIHMNSQGRLSNAVLDRNDYATNLEINSGNVAEYVTMTNERGYIHVYSSGALNHATLGSGAKLTIHSNGSASDIILSSGATMYYYYGARTAEITSMTGAVISQIYHS